MNLLKRLYRRIRHVYSLQQRKRKLSEIKDKLFFNRTLIQDGKGFYFLSPMPTQKELVEYYENSYWIARGDQKVLLKDRDTDHWTTLHPFLKELEQNSKVKRCLNLGAGHGGISHLLFAREWTVTNLEPSACYSVFDGAKWVCVNTPERLNNQHFEFIYASHSLEHVQNIEAYMRMIDAMLVSGGLCFIEVPNCGQTNTRLLQNGGQDGKVIPPHTYYFTTNFFRNMSYECVLLGTYSQRTTPNRLVEGDDGDVIRYLGRKQ